MFWCVYLSQVFNHFCLRARVGADVRIGCEQDSPLHAAVRGGGANVVDLLLDFGADGCCRNAEGKTPLDLSSPNSAVRVALQKRGMLWTLTSSHARYTNTQNPMYLFSRRYNNSILYLSCRPRSLPSVSALSVLHSSKSGKESSPQSLQPVPSSQCQGLPPLPMRRLCPADLSFTFVPCHWLTSEKKTSTFREWD